MIDNKDFKVKLISHGKAEHCNPASYLSVDSLPYGIGVLAAHLRQHNYHVELEDLAVRHNLFRDPLPATLLKNFKNWFLDENINSESCKELKFIKVGKIEKSMVSFLDKILNSMAVKGFPLIGFSIFSIYQFELAMMLSQRLKQRTDAKVVIGGPFVTQFSHFFYPDIFNFVDYVIAGDGRIPLLGLVQYLRGENNLSQIPNLSYKENGEIFCNPKETYPLEDVPIPDFSGLPLGLYEKKQNQKEVLLPYQISRGCVNRCSFCTNMDLSEKLEFKSYDKVLRELKQMHEHYNSERFVFCDDAINNSYEYLDGLCDLFIKHKLNISWHAHARVSNLDRPLLGKMREAGCTKLALGIESGSDRVLKSMNKGFTIEQASKVLMDAQEVGLKVSVSLMAGYPGETKEDVEKTIDFIRQHRQQIISACVFKFKLKYGSSIYFHPDRYGVHNLSPHRVPFHFSFDELNGLPWKRKVKQIKINHRQIAKAFYHYNHRLRLRYNPSVRRKNRFLVYNFLKVFKRIAIKLKNYSTRIFSLSKN